MIQPGLMLGLWPVNERRRYSSAVSHWLGANLESAMCYTAVRIFSDVSYQSWCCLNVASNRSFFTNSRSYICSRFTEAGTSGTKAAIKYVSTNTKCWKIYIECYHSEKTNPPRTKKPTCCRPELSISSWWRSSNGNIFRVIGHLCGEFTGHWWIPRTKASDAEPWCFLWSTPE